MSTSMGFSCGDPFDRGESKVPLTDEETRKARCSVGMDWHRLRDVGVEVVDMEFWPVEHPVEPPDEDRPVKCPMPDASVLNDGGMNDKRFSESLRKRAEVAAVVNRQSIVVVDAEPRVRPVRKRHQTLTHGDRIMRMPPLSPLPTQNVTIFQMLQQFDEFES